MKDVKYCPICGVKKAIHSLQQVPFEDEKYDKTACPTPPMGWSSWNLFREKINEDLIKETADAIEKSGLLAAGYKYINIDDAWQDSRRDDNGRIQCDPYTFPSGIKSLVQYVNNKGLKLGIYSSNGTLTCEDYPASLGHEKQDAETFAEWGIEYFKYDFCHHSPMPVNAPFIVKINLSNNGKSSVLYAKDAFLTGNARLIEDNKVDGGHYIKGLSSRCGTAIFNFESDISDYYDITFTIRKNGREEKFMIATVNGKDNYELTAPGTTAWTAEGKIHSRIFFEKGKNTILLQNPIGSLRDGYAYQYNRMGNELKKATAKYALENKTPEKKIVYSICEWGTNHPWKWAPSAGNLWRTTPDIKPNWLSILAIYEVNIILGKYAGVGSYNDPDMLEVGNGNLNYEENYTHFALWCMMSAPLILGNDIRKFIKNDGTIDKDNKIYKILTNKELIAIDQDELCIPCIRVKKTNGVDVLVKPLINNRVAVCIFNKTNSDKNISFNLDEAADCAKVNLPKKSCYIVKNVKNTEEYTGKSISTTLSSHSSTVYIIE